MFSPLRKWKFLTGVALAIGGAGVMLSIEIGRFLQTQRQDFWALIVGFGGASASMWLTSRIRRRYLHELRRLTPPQNPALTVQAAAGTVLYLRGLGAERRAVRDRIWDTGFNRQRLGVERRVVEASLLALFPSRVVTVADPSDPDPLEGIARVTVDAEHWPDAVAEFMTHARAIVLYHSSNSGGLETEAALIRSLRMTDKTLVIIGDRVAHERDTFKAERTVRTWWAEFPRVVFLARTFSEDEERVDQVELARRIQGALDHVIDVPFISYAPAHLWDRLVAAPEDIVPSMFVAVAQMMILLVIMGSLGLFAKGDPSDDPRFTAMMIWVFASSWPIYLILVESRSGAPAGKRTRQLRVVTMAEGKLSLGQSVFRTLTKLASLSVPASLAWMAMTHESLRFLVVSMLAAAGFLAVSYFRVDRRMLHDLLSGTRVVSTRVLADQRERLGPE